MCIALSIMFNRLGLVSRAAALAVVAGLLTQTALAADAGETVASLEAKGVKFKKEKDGTVSGVFIGPTSMMTFDDFKAIGRLRTLRQLNLSPKEPPLNDEALEALGTLENAEFFFANGAKFTDDGFKVFATWKNLRHFGLDHWGWFETKDKKLVGPGLAYLAVLPKLTSIRLGGCRIGDAAAAAVAKITNLESLDTSHLGITDVGVAQLASLPKLRSIRLSPQFSPRISDVSLLNLSARPTLEAITVSETWLTYDKGFVHLKKLPGLKLIALERVIATGEDIARLKADHPKAEVKWTKPDEETIKKTKAAWERSRVKAAQADQAAAPGQTRIARWKDDKRAALLLTVEAAIATGDVKCLVFHGVGGQWISFPLPEFIAFLDKLEAKRGQLWVAGAIAEHKYQCERDAAEVRVLQTDDRQVRLQLSCKVDSQLYDFPLTLVTRVPAAWKRCRIVQGASKIVVPVADGAVRHEALPGDQPITIAP